MLQRPIPAVSITVPGDGYAVLLVIWPNRDYHWYRQDADGTWSHKPGSTKVITGVVDCPCIKLLTCNWIINNVKNICIAIRSLHIFTTVINIVFQRIYVYSVYTKGKSSGKTFLGLEDVVRGYELCKKADSSSKYNCSAYGATLHALSQHPH